MAEVLDPMTLMLYELHSNLSSKELRTLTAVTNAPHNIRCGIEDGLDLFMYLNEEDLLYKDYLIMLANSLGRKDLVQTIDRFYNDDWKESAFAFTTETFIKTGEVPVVCRSTFRTTELSNKYSHDIVLQSTTLDSDFATALTQGLKERGVKIWEGEFEEGQLQARYVLAVLSKQYFTQGLQDHLLPILREEVNPAASLQRIFPVLVGLTPESLGGLCPEFNSISPFSAISGVAEVIRLVSMTVRNRLKITVSQNYHPAVVLKCSSRAQSGKNQTFEIGLAERDSFTVSRSENSILFRGDKGIKGLRDSQQNGHCVISSNPECPGVILTSMGHPLTIIAVTSPIILPIGTTTLLIGREWISIAAKRNASQCQAKVKLTVSEDNPEVLSVRVTSPKIREEVEFSGCVVLGAGEGSNLRITMPGVDIGKQHCKISKTPEGHWVLRSLAPSFFIFLQLIHAAQEVAVAPGTELLLGTSSVITVQCEEEVDEGIGMSDTCSKISG